jgi:ethanolamine utilization microcompartment shell protein EutL
VTETARRVGGGAELELRTYTFLDRMQPQYAAFIGTVVNGDIPIAGMAQLFIEVAPGNAIFRVADIALKSADVRPGVQIVEREFGVLEIHSASLQAVRAAGEAVLTELGLQESSRIKPTVVSSQVITNVDPYQAQLINKFRRGAMLVPGQTMLVLETSPAAYVSLAANEAEKAADINVVNVNNIGRFGRMFLSGDTSHIQMARDAAVAAVNALSGRT